MTAPRLLLTSLGILLLGIACSATESAIKSPSQSAESSIYPGWYSPSGEFTRTADGTRFMAYGMAVGVDSSSAVRKAITQAETNLEQHLSTVLESVRKRAAEQQETSELHSPEFIFTLRKAEAAVSDASTLERSEASRNEKYGSYRGFAQVEISREALLDELDSAFSENGSEEIWQALKSSSAFSREGLKE